MSYLSSNIIEGKAMISVPISQEFLDKVLVDTLIEDLNMIREGAVRLEALEQLKEIASYQQDDLDYDRVMIMSLEAVLTYYIPHNDYEKTVGVPHPFPHQQAA